MQTLHGWYIVFYLGYKLENHATCRLVKKLSFEVKVGCLQTDVNGKCINCADGFFKV